MIRVITTLQELKTHVVGGNAGILEARVWESRARVKQSLVTDMIGVELTI